MPGLQVLVVEDEVVLALHAQCILEDEGHCVIGIAPDRRDAFRLAAMTRPDVALVDLNLRDGLTGPEIGTRFARDLNIPVLFVTADIERAPLDAPGVLGVLQKPYSPRDLAEVLRTFGRNRVG